MDDESYKNEVLAQLLYADRVLINKTDLVSGESALVAQAWLIVACWQRRNCKPSRKQSAKSTHSPKCAGLLGTALLKLAVLAQTMETKHSRVPVDFVLGIASHHPDLKGIANV